MRIAKLSDFIPNIDDTKYIDDNGYLWVQLNPLCTKSGKIKYRYHSRVANKGIQINTKLDIARLNIKDSSYIFINEFEDCVLLKSGIVIYRVNKGSLSSQSYYTTRIRYKGSKENNLYMLHRLVAICFLDMPYDSKLQVHHIDFDKKNNSYKNLLVMSIEEHSSYHSVLRNNDM